MPQSLEEFRALVNRIRDGSEEAARELLEKYGSYVLRAVRRNLSRRLRTRFDSQDFVQAVWATIFENREQIAEFEKPEALIAFLVTVASRKVNYEFRRHLQYQKNNMNRVRSFESTAMTGQVAVAHDPSPSEIAISNEQWDRIIRDQPPHYRKILELRIAGASQTEIAEQLEINERTVRRVIKKLTDELDQ